MSSEKIKNDARLMLKAALKAADPCQAVAGHLACRGHMLSIAGQSINLNDYKRIIAVGFGKAGASMAQGLEQALGDRLEGGIVVVKDGHSSPTQKIKIIEASHPLPDERGVAAGHEITELLNSADEHTLVFCLISGGGSALMVAPSAGLTLQDKQETTKLLLACGADIKEMNTIRKHLSDLKGGGLARLAAPARVVTLIVSDVVGDRLDTIASGPTVPDYTSWQHAENILKHYNLLDKVPAPVRAHLHKGLQGELPDTPKRGNTIFDRVTNIVVAGNFQSLQAAAEQAAQLGYNTLILSSTMQGETKEIGRLHAAFAKEVVSTGNPLPKPCCLVSGGETTVNLCQDHGLGGRNQEFALAAALDLAGQPNSLILSAGTDGTDGPTDAAGAWADGLTVQKAQQLGLDPEQYLRRHDAYNFFNALGDLIITGPTRTNVMDVHLVLVSD